MPHTRTLACAQAISLLAVLVGSARVSAQPPLVVGPAVDPTTLGAFPAPGSIVSTPEGFSIQAGPLAAYLAGDLASAGQRHQAVGTIIAVGATTYLAATASASWGRVARADDVPLEAPTPVVGATRMFALGDDFVGASRSQLVVWRAAAPASAIEAVAPPCAGCELASLACGLSTCSVLVAHADRSVDAREVDLSTTPASFGAPHDLAGVVDPLGQLRAMGSGWVVFDTEYTPTRGMYRFFDGAWASLGVVETAPPAIVGCTADGCLSVGSGDATRVTRAGASTFTMDSTRPRDLSTVVCGATRCLASARLSDTVYEIDQATGRVVDLPADVWSAAATQYLERLPMWLTSRGPMLVITDRRVGDRAPIAVLEPPRDPVGAPELGDSFVPATNGVLAARADGAWRLAEDASLIGAAALPCLPPHLALASSGDHWDGACAQDDGTVSFFAVASDGVVTPHAATLVGMPLSAPSLARFGAHALLRGWDSGGIAYATLVALAMPGSEITVAGVPHGAALYPIRGELGWVWWGSGGLLHASSLSEDGVVHDVAGTLGSSTGSWSSIRSSAAFDGTWTFVISNETGGGARQVTLRRFGAAGDVPDTMPLRLGDSPQDTMVPAIVSDERGHSWIAYTQADADALAIRVRVRAITTGEPLGASCTADDTCGSGACRGAICCSSPCDGACEVCTATEGARADGICTNLCAADAGAIDVGNDAGATDAGLTDAGSDASSTRDAGEREDASATADAATTVDAATDASPADAAVAGCGCRASNNSPRGTLPCGLLALVLAALVHRRRRGGEIFGRYPGDG